MLSKFLAFFLAVLEPQSFIGDSPGESGLLGCFFPDTELARKLDFTNDYAIELSVTNPAFGSVRCQRA